MNSITRVILAAAIVASIAGCKSKAVKDDGAEVVERDTVADTQPAADDGKFGPDDLETNSCLRQRVVYFDYDRADIGGEAQEILSCHAKYLVDRPSAAITLEGHADERGSREYNLGLGERRGNAVSSALQANGGSAGQLTTVSYGEERPTCTTSDESCWGQNRRVEIVYTAK